MKKERNIILVLFTVTLASFISCKGAEDPLTETSATSSETEELDVFLNLLDTGLEIKVVKNGNSISNFSVRSLTQVSTTAGEISSSSKPDTDGFFTLGDKGGDSSVAFNISLFLAGTNQPCTTKDPKNHPTPLKSKFTNTFSNTISPYSKLSCSNDEFEKMCALTNSKYTKNGVNKICISDVTGKGKFEFIDGFDTGKENRKIANLEIFRKLQSSCKDSFSSLSADYESCECKTEVRDLWDFAQYFRTKEIPSSNVCNETYSLPTKNLNEGPNSGSTDTKLDDASIDNKALCNSLSDASINIDGYCDHKDKLSPVDINRSRTSFLQTLLDFSDNDFSVGPNETTCQKLNITPIVGNDGTVSSCGNCTAQPDPSVLSFDNQVLVNYVYKCLVKGYNDNQGGI